MAGGWQLSLGAKVQGETGTVENKLVLKARMSRAGWALATLAALAAAGGGGYWVGQHGLPAPDRLLAHVPAFPPGSARCCRRSIRSAPRRRPAR